MSQQSSPQSEEKYPHGQADRLAELYGVSHGAITRAGKFAAAVETLRAVDPATTPTRTNGVRLPLPVQIPAIAGGEPALSSFLSSIS